MSQAALSDASIQPWHENPFSWQYQGKPLLLLGGSVEDNLFQVPDVASHLDELVASGGNYVRCTMSSRDPGDVWPFHQREDGRYDLTKLGETYWQRFDAFVEHCQQRDVILQIELWDRFDFAREPWQSNPFNPKNNVNYTAEQSRLEVTYDRHPSKNDSRFFFTVPELENNSVILPFQHAFVDRLLWTTLRYPNVLYCMDNETCADEAWGAYWADYIRRRAEEQGATVQLTEMWDPWDLTNPMHERTWKRPDRYSFCDISQVNHQSHAVHGRMIRDFRAQLIEHRMVRPINTVKIYGAHTGRYGTNRDAVERFFRGIVNGLAATRFHRPPTGLGLGELARKCLRAGRAFDQAMDTPRCQPRPDLLGDHSQNEAHAMANTSAGRVGVFFCDGGHVLIKAAPADATVRWMDVLADGGTWRDAQPAQNDDGRIRLTTPRDTGYWLAVVQLPDGACLDPAGR